MAGRGWLGWLDRRTGYGQFTGSKCSGLARGQPPAARRARTRATSASLAGWSMTVAMAWRIVSADSGLLACASSSAIAFTSLSLSWLPSRANSGM